MMKLNLYLLVAVSLIATPSVALAQAPVPQQPQQIQQQQSKIREIEVEAETEIKAILSPEQQSDYQRARRRGAGLLEALDRVTDLSEEQQTQINTITRQASRRILDLLPRTQRRR